MLLLSEKCTSLLNRRSITAVTSLMRVLEIFHLFRLDLDFQTAYARTATATRNCTDRTVLSSVQMRHSSERFSILDAPFSAQRFKGIIGNNRDNRAIYLHVYRWACSVDQRGPGATSDKRITFINSHQSNPISTTKTRTWCARWRYVILTKQTQL